MNYRPLRVGKLFQHELNELIVRELEFDGALPTITNVSIDKKLEHAKVYISVLPKEHFEACFRTLRASQGRLQHLLMKKLNMRPFPKIEFVPDHGIEHAAEVEKILIREEDK